MIIVLLLLTGAIVAHGVATCYLLLRILRRLNRLHPREVGKMGAVTLYDKD